MEINLKLTKDVILFLQNYYKKVKKESVVAVFLFGSKEKLIGMECHYFKENDYVENSYKYVCIKKEKLRECVIYAIENKYSGFLLIHNHPIWVPFFSKGDKIALKVTTEHLKTYGYPLIHGIGIVTRHRMNILFCDDSVNMILKKRLVEYLV